MFLHVSQTRTLKKFSGELQQQREPSKQSISDNVVAFPTPAIQPSAKENKQPVSAWKEQLITKKQLWYIRLLASQQSISIQNLNSTCYRQYGADLSSMRRVDASDVIQSLKRSLNQEYKPFH
jgi:hypothetical protein